MVEYICNTKIISRSFLFIFSFIRKKLPKNILVPVKSQFFSQKKFGCKYCNPIRCRCPEFFSLLPITIMFLQMYSYHINIFLCNFTLDYISFFKKKHTHTHTHTHIHTNGTFKQIIYYNRSCILNSKKTLQKTLNIGMGRGDHND